MTDVKDRLTRLAPEVDTEAALAYIRHRSNVTRRRRRIIASSVAAVTVLGAVVVAVALDRTDNGDNVVAPPPGPDGWVDLAEPGFGQAFETEGAVWTGQEAIYYGHAGSNDRDQASTGSAYNPATDTWRSIAPSPLTARRHPVVVWAGEEMVVWGGDPLPSGSYEEQGAAYDPDSDSWRLIARVPIEARGFAHAAMVDAEIIIVGGRRVDAAPVCNDGTCSGLPGARNLRDGAAYDPVADRWRTISDIPLVLGEHAESTAADGELRIFNAIRSLAYRVDTDEWRQLSRRRTDGGSLRALVSMHAAGGTAIAVDTSFEYAAGDLTIEEAEIRPQADAFFLYRPDVDRWEPAPRSLPRVDGFPRCDTSLTAVDDELVAIGCTLARIDPGTGEWTPIAQPGASGLGGPQTVIFGGDGIGAGRLLILTSLGVRVATGPTGPDDIDGLTGFVGYRLPEED